MRLPDFVGIGAEKCATSWLFQILSEHPDIYLPRMKEVQFFDERYDRGLEWYGDFFESDAKYVGEVSPQYIHYDHCAPRIAETLPNAKFFLMLRNPIDRAYSHYWMEVRKWKAMGKDILPFEEAIQSDPEFLGKGLYHKQLMNYLAFFPLEQFVILFQEEISESPLAFCQNVYATLGVDDTVVPESLNEKVNVAGDFKSPMAFRIGRGVAKSMEKLGLEAVIVWLLNRGVRDWLAQEDKDYQYPPMAEKTRAKLHDYYAKPNQELADLLERKLPPNWSNGS